MYRVINEVRAQRLLEQPLDYIPHPIVRRPGRWRPRSSRRCRTRRSTRPSGGRCASPRTCRRSWPRCTRCRCSSKEQEQHLFRQMNFLKHKAQQAARAAPATDGAVDPRSRTGPRARSRSCRTRPTRSRTVLINATCGWWCRSPSGTPARRTTSSSCCRDGNMSLIRAVEKFDYGRGLQVQHLRELGDHEELRPQRSRTRSTAASAT